MPSSSQQTIRMDAELRLRLPQLERALQAVDPAAILAPPRILRRVIKQVCDIGGLGLRVPHRKTFIVSRAQLLAAIDEFELDLAAGIELSDPAILIARPTPEALSTQSVGDALIKHWRLLFHARVHLAFDQLAAEGRFDAAGVARRIERIGRSQFEEIRAVLRHEEFLLFPKDDLTTYVEFAAVYLELRYFAGGLLHAYFPSLSDASAVDQVLVEDLDSDALFDATRLPGAPLPTWAADVAAMEPADARVDESSLLQPGRRSARSYRQVMGRANRAAALGNSVRAAILKMRASQSGPTESARQARIEARADLAILVRRLQAALSLPDAEVEDWSKSLRLLLDQLSRGIRSAEARMLYDLQKVCVDHERGVYTLDLVHWVFSFGRAPLKRMLPGQRDVLMTKHLRAAAARTPAVRLASRARVRLAALLQSALHRAEEHLRERFGPLISSALEEVKLEPHNLPERVARIKLVDELLDRIIERGFLSMGDLRDALSRNNLKLPDCTGRQLLVGDQLLEADRRLARSLDGVYRPGEVYLRWSQRLSSLAFGTPLGRFVTQYIVLPFGGAFLILEGLQHIVGPIVVLLQERSAGSNQTEGIGFYEPNLHGPPAIFLLGLILFGLIHHAGFRRLWQEAGALAGRAVRLAVIGLPTWLLELPVVQSIVKSPAFRLLRRYLFKPLFVSLLAAAALSLLLNRQTIIESSLAIFVVVNLLLNSRFGRNVDEMVTDWLVHVWHRIRIHVFAAILRLIVDVFNRILKTIERLLYAVDEWLRFRTGESRLTIVVKAALGTVWVFVDYIIRIYVNLLIEPQINPIKHFPVVTVSHKLILPFSLKLTGYLATPLMPLGVVTANAIAGTTVFLLPGVFGFLVWELKENWRLYAANRPKDLKPILIGHHGETVSQFLRPGFRSGTLPKLYARLRKAERKAQWTGNWKTSGKHTEALHGVEEHLRRFVDRELVELVRLSHGWGLPSLASGEIHLGINRVLIELYCPQLGEQSLWLAFAEQSGALVASVHARGWADRLSPLQRSTLENALAGFYKMAGVDLVHEQLAAQLESFKGSYEVSEAGLMVHGGTVHPQVTLFDLAGRTAIHSPTSLGGYGSKLIDDRAAELIFARAPISWQRWVAIWEIDQAGQTGESVVGSICLLPPSSSSNEQ